MGNNNKNTSDRYAEAYNNILNTYSEQIKTNINSKTLLKENYLEMIKRLMCMISVLLFISVIGSLGIFIFMIFKEYHSVTMIAGAITSILTALSPMMLAIFRFPEIIGNYLFNKEEDKSMGEIIKGIQDYTIESKKLDEKMAPYKSKEDTSTGAKEDSSMVEVNEEVKKPVDSSPVKKTNDSEHQKNENVEINI